MFVPEDYLQILPLNLAYTLVHFRTLTHRLQIQRGRVLNLPYEDRLCSKCSFADISDEFHYVFSPPPPPPRFFSSSLSLPFLQCFSRFTGKGNSDIEGTTTMIFENRRCVWCLRHWCCLVLCLDYFVVGFDLSTVSCEWEEIWSVYLALPGFCLFLFLPSSRSVLMWPACAWTLETSYLVACKAEDNGWGQWWDGRAGGTEWSTAARRYCLSYHGVRVHLLNWTARR